MPSIHVKNKKPKCIKKRKKKRKRNRPKHLKATNTWNDLRRYLGYKWLHTYTDGSGV